MDRLHPATRALVGESDPNAALTLARALVECPPPDWDSREWASIAAAANAKASSEPRWFKVKAVACANDTIPSASIQALWARANLIAALGRDDVDEFCSLIAFIQHAEAFVRGDSPEAALDSYGSARAVLLSAERSSPRWVAARNVFLRCRGLRERARVLAAVARTGNPLPPHLQQWTGWADLEEHELSVDT